MDDWVRKGLSLPLKEYYQYLSKRGVTSESSVRFCSWSLCDSPCPKFTSQFGKQGGRLQKHLIIPITSPRDKIIGLEARLVMPDGSKRVTQYRSVEAQWNPYFLGAPEAFSALHQGHDLWIVEGVFDKVALDKVVPKGDAVIATLRAGMDTLSIDMIRHYYRPSSTIYVCYDNDETGRKKSSWLDMEFKKRSMRSIVWKYRGKDPNDVFTRGGEPALIRAF